MERNALLDRLYSLLDDLERQVGGMQRLGDCDGYMDWPDRGVYFFFATDEYRTNGDKRRLTRVGTHAVSDGSDTSLWNRLRTHRGALSGTYEDGGNHRGSVFRERVGEALIERHDLHDDYPEWGHGSSASRDRRLAELDLERRVSDYIRELPFLWVKIDDEPSSDSDRAYVERNTIALASNYRREAIDPRADGWLGTDSPSEKIRNSGLWNVDHVDESSDPAFLDRLAGAIEETGPP
ncbi:hypothetical protein [Haloplanus halophilus]|uniref:hypothetical protein n=1 Tax=Haloplanus halophilus TaxID=2949993 RepID=UPI00203BCD81|nr:hypothetical protein [Haloplanus sp. GDY1]